VYYATNLDIIKKTAFAKEKPEGIPTIIQKKNFMESQNFMESIISLQRWDDILKTL